MARYRCADCGAVFDVPKRITNEEYHAEVGAPLQIEKCVTEICPVCGDYDFFEMSEENKEIYYSIAEFANQFRVSLDEAENFFREYLGRG